MLFGEPQEEVDPRQVFISYSHLDDEWAGRLKTILAPLQQYAQIHAWSDEELQPGSRWHDEVMAAIGRAHAAILLVTPNFLDSSYIREHEMPAIMARHATGELPVHWIAVKHCLWRQTQLADLNAANDAEHPLNSLSDSECSRTLVKIAEGVLDQLDVL